MKRAAAILAATSLVLSSAEASGQDLPARGVPDTAEVHPLIFTVSGGISRGSYQGGLNWGLVEIARRSTYDGSFRDWVASLNPKLDTVPRLFITAAGGASAGNINALLSAVEWCRMVAATKPEETVFWQVWVWTGWDQLMWNAHTVRDDEHGIFDRRFFSNVLKAAIDSQIKRPRGFKPNCRVPVGVTTTRLLPDTVTVASGIQASVQRFGIPFVVSTDAQGRIRFGQPTDTILTDPTLGEMLVLPNPPAAVASTGSDGGAGTPLDLGLGGVFSAIEASSAFPVAFAPRTLEYHKASDVLPGGTCRLMNGATWLCDSVRVAQFVDGGVFDNNPLGLAYGLYRCMPHTGAKVLLETRQGQSVVKDGRESSAFCRAPPREATLVYMDPDARRDASGAGVYPNLERGTVEGFSPIPKLLGGAVQTGRQYELAVFGRTVKLIPGADKLRQVATDRYQAIVGDHFSAFGAFLGRPFREFDFYAGVFDAVYFASMEWFCAPASAASSAQPSPATRQCAQRMITAAICDGVFQLDIAARSVMATLFEQEFGGHVSCANGSFKRARDSADEVTRARITVLEAVARGNEQIRSVSSNASAVNQDPFACKKLQFLEEALCANGFRILLDSLATPSAKRALELLLNQPACKSDFWETSYLGGCHADSTVWNLVDSPIAAADELFRAVFRRLVIVENGRRLERAVDAGELAYYIGRAPNLSGLAFFTTSIPNTGRPGEVAGRLIPFQVSITFGNNSFITGYRPTLYTRKGFQLVFPLEYSSMRRLLEQPNGDFRREQVRTFNPGAGVGWLFGTNWIESVQLTGFWSIRNSSRCDVGSNMGAEVSTVGLFNRLRLGYRLNPWCDRGVKKRAVIIGLSDVNGLFYWTARLLR